MTVKAINPANEPQYKLAASNWTGNPNRGEELTAHIDAGVVFVNGIVKSDPRLPLGGVKRSHYRRDLSEFGIRGFVNVKTVAVTWDGRGR